MPIITYEHKTDELKKAIKEAFEEAMTSSRDTACEGDEENELIEETSDPIIKEMAETLSEQIGDAIKEYIESITVKINPGITAILQAPATVVGSAGPAPVVATVPTATFKTVSEGTS